MKYASTRCRSITATFEEAICSGYAPDGGLFVPQSLPQITRPMLRDWLHLSYPELSERIMRFFVDSEEIPDGALHEIITNSFTKNWGISSSAKWKDTDDDNNETSSLTDDQKQKLLAIETRHADFDNQLDGMFGDFSDVEEITQRQGEEIKRQNAMLNKLVTTKQSQQSQTDELQQQRRQQQQEEEEGIKNNEQQQQQQQQQQQEKQQQQQQPQQQQEKQQQQKQQQQKPQHIPVCRIGSYYVAELFHGPTFCFKDFGMRVLIHCLSYFSTIRNKHISLLVSTTGDTGPAAVQAVNDANNSNLTILVHYPYNQISNFQRKQLTTISSPYVQVATFHGGGDDMDMPIKNILNKQKDGSNTNKSYLITGINSYNIGRPLMQMVHFIWTYLRIVENLGISPGDPDIQVDIVLPTGAMGNIAGGYMAKKMGVPIGKLCSGVNINDITYRVIRTGQFHSSNHNMQKTLSEAINIQTPYNFERVLFYLTNENHQLIQQWMTNFETNNNHRLDLPTEWLHKLQKDFDCERVTDDELCEMIRTILQQYKYYVDPHTAVAFCAAKKLGYPLQPLQEQQQQKRKNTNDSIVALLATASPCKFQEAVTEAIGQDGWMHYSSTQSGLFPSNAVRILQLPENDPIVYEFPKGDTLESVQIQWEKKAMEIIHSFLQLQA